jgi:hypothetical protein
MASEKDLGTYEMLWDCRNCDTKKLLGQTHRFCPNCGSPQDPAWRYFPSDEEKIAVADHEFTGVDVICPACDVPNSRAAKHCVACGGELVKAKDAATRSDQEVASGGKFGSETAKDAKKDREAKRAARDAPPPKPPSKFTPKVIAIVSAVVLLLATIIVALTWKKVAVVTVTGHHWEREIDVERYGPKSESAWCNELPGGAYRISRSREVRSHKKVADGKTCKTKRKDKGNGTFKEVEECETKYKDEPVYDDRCTFVVDRWQKDRTLEQKGASLAEAPIWPIVNLLRTGVCIGCEREGSHREIYEVELTQPPKPGEVPKTSNCAYPQDKWAAIADGSRWQMKFAVMTGMADCDSMKPPK